MGWIGILVTMLTLLCCCHSESEPAKPILANGGVWQGPCKELPRGFGSIPASDRPYLPGEVCKQQVGAALNSPSTPQNWPTVDGHPAGHHWVEVERSPAGQVTLDLPLPHTLTGILVAVSGQAYLVSNRTLGAIRGDGSGITTIVDDIEVLSAGLDESERACFLSYLPGVPGTVASRHVIHCFETAATGDPVKHSHMVLESRYSKYSRYQLYRIYGDTAAWIISGSNGICLRFDDGVEYFREGSTYLTPQRLAFPDSSNGAADCARPVARPHPIRAELAVAFEATKSDAAHQVIDYGDAHHGSSDVALERVCVRAPAKSGVLLSNASVFTPGGLELVCGATCGEGPPESPIFKHLLIPLVGSPVEYAAWWHSLPDGTPMHLGLLLGAFGNDDLLTGVGRVNHKTGAAVWKWPSWLDPKAEDLKHAHVVLDSNDNVYIGLQRELVGFAKNGTVRWRLPLPDQAKVSAMGLSYAGVLWVGLNLPNGTARVWRVH